MVDDNDVEMNSSSVSKENDISRKSDMTWKILVSKTRWYCWKWVVYFLSFQENLPNIIIFGSSGREKVC